ncbi:MAG TPA: cytochrome c biogenesis protein DipZ [Caulobacteraceae bacterium]|jgi:cytochrome c biogenesis protein CcdA/thiol-disulfide isomerase/thioredoxin
MILFLLAYLGGALTIVSPCILPVLPFVFARADRKFATSGLPMLVGLCLAFAAVATLASVAGGWAVQANAAGRWAAMALLAVFGLTLLFPALADRLTRPLVALGGRLTERIEANKEQAGDSVAPSLALGVATGLLWAPCAGPILGLILTGAAIQGANAKTTLLLLAYALGAATSLALALLIGGRVFSAMKRSLHAGEWIRRGLGVLVLGAVACIALGLDTGFLTQVSTASTTQLEQGLLDRLHAAPPQRAPANLMASQSMTGPAMAGPSMTGPSMTGPSMTGPAMTAKGPAMTGPASGNPATASAAGGGLPVLGPMPPLDGASQWLNSPPLTRAGLKGKVVLVDFWTYSCINCIRALPYVEAWAKRYGPQGLVVIGVHTPEFAFEKQQSNVERAIKTFGITYPVAMDNDYSIWQAFDNNSWPAHYFIDAEGNVRHVHLGEGEYDKSEEIIRTLLAERNGAPVTGSLVGKAGTGVQEASAFNDAYSPETYLGYGRAERFASPGGERKDQSAAYAAPDSFRADGWALTGSWKVEKEQATALAAGDRILFRFRARDLHMVLGPSPGGKPIRFRITIDGKPPGDSHGLDTDSQGNGAITTQRLYQLVRQPAVKGDRTFQIEFLDPGVQAFTFTFG